MIIIGLSPTFGATARRSYIKEEYNQSQVFEDTVYKETYVPSLSGERGGTPKAQANLLRLHNVTFTATRCFEDSARWIRFAIFKQETILMLPFQLNYLRILSPNSEDLLFDF
jgi:hypothetical protein